MTETRTVELFKGTYAPVRASHLDDEAMRQLAASVLQAAVDALTRGNPAAISWFNREDSNLALWAEILNLDPAVVRERALAMPEKRPLAPKNKKRVEAAARRDEAAP
jgi:hypothetical protein